MRYGIPATKNIKYDILCEKIVRKYAKANSNCVDIGCHKGEFLDIFLKYCPDGKHTAFEPIPQLYTTLSAKYPSVQLHQLALSTKKGNTTFQHVTNAPAYSGLKKRKYDIDNPIIEEIPVKIDTLDNILTNHSIDILKIDVEGGEYGVLSGGKSILQCCKPLVLFEFGIGAADHYGTSAKIMHSLFTSLGYKIYTLVSYYKKSDHLSQLQFTQLFESGKEFFWVASADG